jgi:enoyl-CoA hydratase/carnithine racemase
MPNTVNTEEEGTLVPMYELIETETRGHCGVIRFNRPRRRNALSIAMLGELADAIALMEGSADVCGIVITGSDECFSSGADLNDALEVDTPDKFTNYISCYRDVPRRMENCRKPIVAAISGHCMTGGLELAMAADVRIAAENAEFAMTSARIGSVPGAGGTQRLPRLVGSGIAMELLFTGRVFDARYAKEIGLVSSVVPDGTCVAAAEELVESMAVCAPLSIAWMKAAVHTGTQVDLDSALSLEVNLCGRAFATEDRAEGMRAFLEKRQPRFSGK